MSSEQPDAADRRQNHNLISSLLPVADLEREPNQTMIHELVLVKSSF